jgi:CheY-like chemotaxis protein
MYSHKNKLISILIVDDNQLDRLIVQTLLQPHFNIETVSNGYDALSIIEEIKFDVILMDINLGDINMSGTNVLKLIRENPKHNQIKIFAVTAFPDEETSYTALGFEELFIKPVLKEEIFIHIKKE